MSVPREEVTLNGVGLLVKATKAVRQKAGRWSVVLEIIGTIHLDGTRSLRVDREVRISECQRGRKARK